MNFVCNDSLEVNVVELTKVDLTAVLADALVEPAAL
jgi:hypothetical protein